MKQQQLICMFNTLEGSGQRILVRDLLCRGYNETLIRQALKETAAMMICGSDGYSVIVL